MSEPIDGYRGPVYPPGPYPPASAPPAPPAQYQQAPYQQAPYQQAPYQQAPYQRAPYQEGRPYTGEYGSLALPAVQQDPAAVQQVYPAALPNRPGAAGYQLVSPAGRLGAAMLDLMLIMFTFGIGWLIWSAVTWSNGQSPAKSLLGYVVADAGTGEAFGWDRMAVREFLIRFLLFGPLGAVTLGLFSLLDACMVFGPEHRTLHDQMAGSVVRVG
ncbi:RDD family protein [Actinoplanes sp. NPDC026623]|uniref:RDD family protein n=1 Tax=Actinoplanes sp. NPDC026623 TaxID=3155610 RepID=UPI0033E8EEBF